MKALEGVHAAKRAQSVGLRRHSKCGSPRRMAARQCGSPRRVAARQVQSVERIRIGRERQGMDGDSAVDGGCSLTPSEGSDSSDGETA